MTGKIFCREFVEGAALSAMNYIHDTAEIGDTGGRAYTIHGISSRDIICQPENRKDKRHKIHVWDRRCGTGSRFSLGGMLKSALLGGMVDGNAPIGYDGKSVQLHHLLQTQDAPIVEVSQTFHNNYYSTIHMNTGQLPPTINRSQFNS